MPDDPDKTAGDPGKAWYRAAVAAACVAGALNVIICAATVNNYFQMNREEFPTAPELAGLKARLDKAPADEKIRQAIREVDLQLRMEYFRRRERFERGAYLLFGSFAVFIIAVRLAVAYRKKPPMPGPYTTKAGADARAARAARWAVAAMALFVGGGAVVLAITSGTGFEPAQLIVSDSELTPPRPVPAGGDLPSAEEIKRNWPRFRGPGGSGISAYANIPATWNVKTGENIVWKTPVPLKGMNSPVAWGDRVFLTGAKKGRREVYCFHAETGKLLWTRPVRPPNSQPDPEDMFEDTSLAASTCCTDGRRVYAIFPNGDLAAFDFAGESVWSRNIGMPDNAYGYASSLLIWRNLLIVQYDQSDEEKSALLAIDTATGRTVWKKKRPVGGSWTTPIVATTAAGEQLITVSDPWVIAYKPATGEEIWRADVMGADVAPSPVFAAGALFAVTESARLTAIDTGGIGDVTKDYILWTGEDDLPNICSPLSDGKLLYTLTSESPVLTCYEAAGGKRLWTKEYENLRFHSSPSLVGGRIYLFAWEGTALVLKAGRKYKELARIDMLEGVHTCPAFLDGRMYIRGEKHLFCIGSKTK